MNSLQNVKNAPLSLQAKAQAIKVRLGAKGAVVEMIDSDTGRWLHEFTFGAKLDDIEGWLSDHPTAVARHNGRPLWNHAPQELASEAAPNVVKLVPKAEPASQVESEAELAPPQPEPGDAPPWDAAEVARMMRPAPEAKAKLQVKKAAQPKPKPQPAADVPPDDEAEVPPESESTTDEVRGDANQPEGNLRRVSFPESKRPCHGVFDDWVYLIEEDAKLKPGVYRFDVNRKGEQPVLSHLKLCTPLHVMAIASDDCEGNFGRVLRFIDSKKNWKRWAMPMELLSSLGNEMRAELLSMGAIPNPGTNKQFIKFLTDEEPKVTINCATQVGWCRNHFVLPDEVIGTAKDNFIFQSSQRVQAEYGQRGTIEGWREHVSAYAAGNAVYMMVISASFVGPLLEKVGSESGGVHLFGNSSTGKTTLLRAAASVWGGPGHARSWNATANGMEGVATLFNDSLLALDEISECSAKDIDRIVYALTNGVGRQRASRSGAARSTARWRCFVLSNGERALPTVMGVAGIKAKAGQLVRLIDLPVERQHGAWDNLHGLPSGKAMSDTIKANAAKHYGKAGRAFVECMTRDYGRNWPDEFDAMKRSAVFTVDDDDDGQAQRVAGRFALIAFAGEVATAYGITGWQPGEATDAAATMFRVWRAQRQSGSVESVQVLEQIEAFIDSHGTSRFGELRKNARDAVEKVFNQVGWRENDYAKGQTFYLFTADGMRQALDGLEFKLSLKTLADAGVLLPGHDGKNSQLCWVFGENKRIYRISLAVLQGR